MEKLQFKTYEYKEEYTEWEIYSDGSGVVTQFLTAQSRVEGVSFGPEDIKAFGIVFFRMIIRKFIGNPLRKIRIYFWKKRPRN